MVVGGAMLLALALVGAADELTAPPVAEIPVVEGHCRAAVATKYVARKHMNLAALVLPFAAGQPFVSHIPLSLRDDGLMRSLGNDPFFLRAGQTVFAADFLRARLAVHQVAQVNRVLEYHLYRLVVPLAVGREWVLLEVVRVLRCEV